MNKVIIAFIFVCMLIPKAYTQARTQTEFYSRAGQHTYDKATDGVTDRHYTTYKERNKYNSEKYVCLFKSKADKWGRQYVVHTSGIITANYNDGGIQPYEIYKCHRTYDSFDNFNSWEELKRYAQQVKQENRSLKYKYW